MAVRLPVPAASRLVKAVWLSLGRAQGLQYASFKASSLPAAGTSAWGWPGGQLSEFCGAGGEMSCTPAVGVSGASFLALTLQIVLGASPQVGSREPWCTRQPSSPGGARCSVPVGSVPGRVAFPSQPCTAGHWADSFWVSWLCPSAASAWLPAGWRWSGCLSTISVPACVRPHAWNSFLSLQIR